MNCPAKLMLDTPDGKGLEFNTFDELTLAVINNPKVQKYYERANDERPIKEAFEDFLQLWFQNGCVGKYNFYTAKVYIEPAHRTGDVGGQDMFEVE